MLVDGKKYAEEIRAALKEEIKLLGKTKIRLAVLQIGEDAITKKFLEQKKKFGETIGVDVRIYSEPRDISTNALRKKLAEIAHIKQNTAVIVQLPLPEQIKTQYILDGIPPEKDPDMLSSKSMGKFLQGRSEVLPPVVSAINYIFEKSHIDPKGMEAVVIGAGRLVGKPTALWLVAQGATVTICDDNTKNLSLFTKEADIVISGVGSPGLIKQDMVSDGAVVIDAGTSEDCGKVVGDCDPEIANKASFFTPVPGGVGPITVAMLFQNIVTLATNV